MYLTTFGLGRMRPASGTWGSLPPAVIGAGLMWIGQGPRECVISGGPGSVWYLAMAVMVILPSWWCIKYGSIAEAVNGRKDPGFVVADETAGMALTLICLPHFAMTTPILAMRTIALAFFAFRLFDVLKLWPANGMQKYSAGWGILLDDLVAAIQAAVLMWVVAYLARGM